jgi:hypothetical protein
LLYCLYYIHLEEEEMPQSLFRTIPPERIGLNGEYDHSGLAKRVLQVYQTQFSMTELQGLQVMQRGRVVLLMGDLPSRSVLNQLVTLALQVEGAAAVEVDGMFMQQEDRDRQLVLRESLV